MNDGGPIAFTPAPSVGRRARRLMIQGTGSDVGKSLLVAGLARAYARRGLAVQVFKAQNMSNNAAVAPDADAPPAADGCPASGEIGRAQALQARAAGVARSVHQNPVLLKPDSDTVAQVVLRGRVLGRVPAADYQRLKPRLLPAVLDSLERLSQRSDLVLVEGAGSGAEAYLRAQDIGNMGLAVAADLPVLLLGDESRGGVTAAAIGHHALWSAGERARVGGVLVNKFRGDAAIFAPAAEQIRRATGWPVLALLGWFDGAAQLPQEDSLALDAAAQRSSRRPPGQGGVPIAVLRTPRLANADDLDPLAAEPGVELRWVQAGEPIPREARVVILAGSKATRADLAFVRAQGWHHDLHAHRRHGGHVVGLCAGLQMLGREVSDPLGLEGEPGASAGLGLLDLATTLTADKRLREIDAIDRLSGQRVHGFEMHMGRSAGADLLRPWLDFGRGDAPRPEGAVSADGRVRGCYVHGLFAADGFRRHWLDGLGARAAASPHEARVEALLDAYAAQLARELDLDALWRIAR